MATEVVELDEQELTKGFADAAALFDGYVKRLRAMEDGPMKTALALEYSQEAKRYLDAVKNSELRDHVTRLHQEHQRASKWLKRVLAPGELCLKYCVDIRRRAEITRQAMIEESRREKERQANLFQEKQRQAEIEHLRELGKEQEAETRAKAPIIPITVNVDRNAGKPAGESTTEVWRPKRDDNGEIVFSDLCSYLAWLVGNPALYYFIKHQYGPIKKWLTDNRGLMQPPGMEIEHTFEPRTKSSDE